MLENGLDQGLVGNAMWQCHVIDVFDKYNHPSVWQQHSMCLTFARFSIIALKSIHSIGDMHWSQKCCINGNHKSKFRYQSGGLCAVKVNLTTKHSQVPTPYRLARTSMSCDYLLNGYLVEVLRSAWICSTPTTAVCIVVRMKLSWKTRSKVLIVYRW